jgi:hypothetical protein
MNHTYEPGRRYRVRRPASLFYRIVEEGQGMIVRRLELAPGSELVVLEPAIEPDLDRDGQLREQPPAFAFAGRRGYLDPSARGWPVAGLLEALD